MAIKKSTIGMGLGAVGGGVAGGPVGAMLGAGLGGAIGGMFDGDGAQQAAPVQVDPNDPRFQWGSEGATQYTRDAAASQSRAAPTTSYAQADADYQRSLEARGQQQGLATRLTGILDGTGPATEAQLQLQRGQQDAANLGQQMAASARGTGALLMQRQAMNAGVMGAQRAGQDAAMLRAHEEAAARGELAGLLGGMRGGDMSSRAESAGQQQFLTEAELRQRAANDQYSLGLGGLANEANQAQLDANVRIAQGNQGGANGMASGNADRRGDADQRDRAASAQLYGGLTSTGVSAMGSSKPAPPAPAAPRDAGGYVPGVTPPPGGNPYTNETMPGSPPAGSIYMTGGSKYGPPRPWGGLY